MNECKGLVNKREIAGCPEPKNFGTFSFTCFSSRNIDTQDGDNEAAAKSYSEPMYASVNTEQL